MNKYSNMSNWWQDLPTAYDSVSGAAKFRVNPEDFLVDEELSFIPDGEGENVLLRIQKRELNTEQVAKVLARFANVKLMDVGYAGLKDRNAITTQWFSVRIPGKVELDWSQVNDEQISVLEVTKNLKKLRRGVIKCNRFQIIVREFAGDFASLSEVVEKVKTCGVPNYFGDQRFGRGGANVEKAFDLFSGEYKPKGKVERGMLLSAARSFIFNQILSSRVERGDWNQLITGDVAIFDNNDSFFDIQEPDDAMLAKLESMDLHPAAALFGSGEFRTTGVPNQVEAEVVEQNADLAKGCKNNNMRMERRAMRLSVHDLQLEKLSETELKFSFGLKTGAYATAVLREMVNLTKG